MTRSWLENAGRFMLQGRLHLPGFFHFSRLDMSTSSSLPRRGRRRSRCPDALPEDVQRLIGRVRRSDAATLAHRLAPVMVEIDAAILAGRVTWSELALALGVPRTSAHSARERARTLAAELRAHGLLPPPVRASGPSRTSTSPAMSPGGEPSPMPRSTPVAQVPEGYAPRSFQATVHDVYGTSPTEGDGAEEGVEGAEPVGTALRRMIKHGSHYDQSHEETER